MTLRDWFSRKTALQAAIERGTQPGGKLSLLLQELNNYRLTSAADANAVCDVLERLLTDEPNLGGDHALYSLIKLFDKIDGTQCPAFGVLNERGLALLLRLCDEAKEQPELRDGVDVLNAADTLAKSGTASGTDAVLRLARQSFQADSANWMYILAEYNDQHPERERLLKALSDPLPGGLIAHGLAINANDAHGKGRRERHPFDSDAGVRQLAAWLAHPDRDEPWFAACAVGALPFPAHADADRLLAIALEHADRNVQLEAAAAAARLGRAAGVRWLARACQDVNLSERAEALLREIGREDAVPSLDAEFRARAHFAAWLAHPSELGHPVDTVSVYDSSELVWPPDGQQKKLWLLRYEVSEPEDMEEIRVGVGMVGSVTFCLFYYHLEERPPEDGYAIHAYWEMREWQNLIVEETVSGESSEFDGLLAQHAGGDVTAGRIELVAEISPTLKHPQRLVAVAKAQRGSEPGWLILDGPRSRFYPATEMPAQETSGAVLMLHVGRGLLGFHNEPDRRKFLKTPVKRPAESLVRRYEELLERARTNPDAAKKLLESGSALARKMPDYVAALAEVHSRPAPSCACQTFESLIALIDGAVELPKYNLLESWSPVGHRNLEIYVDALVALDRRVDAARLLERLGPHWDSHRGNLALGVIAYRGGLDSLAESFFMKTVRPGECSVSYDMQFLAEVWHRAGRQAEAQALLIGGMKRIIAERPEAKTDGRREELDEAFQAFRDAYLRLFPELGEAALKRQGVPATAKK